MTTLENDVSNYKVFCLVRHYKESDPKALKEYIELKGGMHRGKVN